MKPVETDKKVLMQRSINRACARERFVGFTYFLATLALAVLPFFTMMTNVAFAPDLNLNITTIWGALFEVGRLGYSLIPIGMNFFIAVLYLYVVLHCVVSALRSLALLDNLYMKGNQKIGFNQNAIAMEKLGHRFSSSFLAITYLMYFVHMFLGGKPTMLYYATAALFLVLHFWLGTIGAKASRFTARDGVKELPRTKGRVAPFVRNVMQFVLVGLLMAFTSQANVINNILFYFDGNNWLLLFAGFEAHFGTFIANFVNPFLQLLICHFMLVIVVHACRPTEWNKDGSKGKGMKVCRVFSFLIFLCALAFNLTHLYLNLAHGVTTVSMQMIYVMVIALAFFIMECCMAKLPGEKKAVATAEPVETLEETPAEAPAEEAPVEEGVRKIEVLPAKYKYVDAPAIYLQPNGQPIMVMPMMEVVEVEAPAEEPVAEAPVAEETPAEEAPVEKLMAIPVGANALAREEYKKSIKAKWMARAKGNPEEETEEKPLKKPAETEDTFELGEEKKVKCPHCGEKVYAQVGAPAYICPVCKEKFSF